MPSERERASEAFGWKVNRVMGLETRLALNALEMLRRVELDRIERDDDMSDEDDEP